MARGSVQKDGQSLRRALFTQLGLRSFRRKQLGSLRALGFGGTADLDFGISLGQLVPSKTMVIGGLRILCAEELTCEGG